MILENLLQRWQSKGLPSNYEKYQLSRAETVLYYGCGCLLALLVSLLCYRQVLVSLLVLPLLRKFRPFLEDALARKRQRKLYDQFRDLLYALSSAVSTGRHLADAMEESISHLSRLYGKEAFIVLELEKMIHSFRESRTGTGQLLLDFGKRSGLSDIRTFADIYSICLGAGGDLDRVILRSSQIMLEKIEILREIQVQTAQKLMEVRILSLIPIGILALLQLTSPSYLDGMYQEPGGRLVMTLALGLQAGAFYLGQKIVTIEV